MRHCSFDLRHRHGAAVDQPQLPVLGGRAGKREVAGEIIEPLGVGAARGAEAVLQVVGRRRLIIERRLHRRGLARELRERHAIDERVAAARRVVGIAVDGDRRGLFRQVSIGAERVRDPDPLCERQESARQQPVVLHLGALCEEARGEPPLCGNIGAAARCRAVGGRRRQLLVDLHLILAIDHLAVRLVDARVGIDPRGAVGLPPEFAGQRRALLVDQHTLAVGPSGRPKHVVLGVEHLEIDEGATEADPRRKLVPGLVGHRHACAQAAVLAPDLVDRDGRGAVGRLLQHGGFRVRGRLDADGAEHGIAEPDAEDICELPRHLDEEHVEADEGVLADVGAHRQVDLARRQRLLGLGEVAELLDGGDLAAIGRAFGVLLRHVAVLAGLRLSARPERQRSVGCRARAVVAERPFGIGGLLVDVADGLAAMQDRQMHGVAGAAHLGGQGVRVVRGRAADRTPHRQRLRLLERAVELVGRADQEAAGERPGKSREVGIERLLALEHAGVLRVSAIFRFVRLAEHHAVAGGAGHAVARQRAVMRELADGILRRIGRGVDGRAREGAAASAAGTTVDGGLALAEDAVAAEATVLDRGRGGRMERLRLARELREEDRITSRKPHRRAAPGAVG